MSELAQNGASPRRVLVVDDDPVIQTLLRVFLTRAGWNVVVASDAVMALDHLSSASFDLLITDVNMPGMSGIELLQRVRTSPPTALLRAVLLSGSDVAVDLVQHDELTIILAKPVNPTALVARLGSWFA